ncbi:unnamed protein product [Larinioides sclopetarius]|uniref:Uncharacterized protein n=2 Tax=Larinioides sclopetarius TaxID=280406 RepID=A0AAV1Z740_9ARAC
MIPLLENIQGIKMAASKTVFCCTLVFVLLQCITISSAGLPDAVGTMAPLPSGLPSGIPTGIPSDMPTIPTNPAGTALPVTPTLPV